MNNTLLGAASLLLFCYNFLASQSAPIEQHFDPLNSRALIGIAMSNVVKRSANSMPVAVVERNLVAKRFAFAFPIDEQHQSPESGAAEKSILQKRFAFAFPTADENQMRAETGEARFRRFAFAFPMNEQDNQAEKAILQRKRFAFAFPSPAGDVDVNEMNNKPLMYKRFAF